MICAKGGGLASANEIFTVGCSVVRVAFEFLMSTDDGRRGAHQMKVLRYLSSVARGT